MPYFSHQQHRLFYREKGQGPLLLILPGNTASSACHASELEYFGKRYHAVSMDFWGTGQSERVARWPVDWFQQSAHDAAALVEHLGEKQALVMGTSGGAMTACWMAILHPECVRAVIADSEVECFPPEKIKELLKGRQQRTPDQVKFWTIAHGDDWPQVVDADSDMLLRFEMAHTDHFDDRLGEILCPVQLSASLADDLLPEVAQQTTRMLGKLADGRLYLSSKGVHPLMWSSPADFRAVCDCFLEQVENFASPD